MKTFIFFVFTMSMTSSVFATHAYRTMDCQSNDLQLRYKGNYAVGGDYGISRSGGKEFLALPNESEIYGDAELNSADVVFKIVSATKISEVETSEDCGFDHTEKQTRTVVNLDRVSPDAGLQLGVNQGDSVTLVCEETLDIPNGKECE